MAAKYVSFGMRSLSLALALFAFAGCAPAQTTRTIYVHEVVVVEAPRASAKARPHQNIRHGWAPGHAHAPASPHVTRSVSVVTVEQQVLIQSAPRQTDNPIPRRSAFFATTGDRSSKGDNERGRAVDDRGRSKETHAGGAPRRSKRTKGGSEVNDRQAKPRERDAMRDDPKKKRDAVPDRTRGEAKHDAKNRDAQRKAAQLDDKKHKARERNAKRNDAKKKRDAQRNAAPDKSPAEPKRDAKNRDAKKKEQDRKREARADAKARPSKAKVTAKKRRAAQKRTRPSLQALARR